MTREDYLKLVRSSAAFKAMAPETQGKILNAEGADMGAYLKIFQEEEKHDREAKKKFVNTTVKIVEQFESDAKMVVIVKRQKNEDNHKKGEDQEAEKLLTQINNL